MNGEQYSGHWWRPGRSEERWPGKLTVSDKRPPVLELDGSFEEATARELPEYDVIHGDAGGFELSLFDVAELDRPFRSPRSQTLIVQHVLSGGHLAADSTFDELVVEMDHLAEWVAMSLIQYDEKLTPDGALESAEVRFIESPQQSARLKDGTKIELSFLPARELTRGSVTLSQSVALRVLSPGRGSTLDLLETRLASIVDLVTFLSGQANKVTDATLLTPQLTYTDNQGTHRRTHIKWLRAWDRARRGEAPEPTGVVFRLVEVAGRWPEIIDRWFTIREKVGYPLDLLAALAYAPPHHADLRLLLAVQACEGYHQKMFPSRRHEARDAFADRCRRIAKRVSKKDMAWLTERINNDAVLIDRLHDLVEKTREPLADLHAAFPEWAERVKKERNRMSHGNRMTSIPVEEMLELVDCTLIVLSACLVVDLGLSPQECGQVFANHSRYMRLVHDHPPTAPPYESTGKPAEPAAAGG